MTAHDHEVILLLHRPTPPSAVDAECHCRYTQSRVVSLKISQNYHRDFCRYILICLESLKKIPINSLHYKDLNISYSSTYLKTSIKRRVPNKRQVSNKRRGSEALVLIHDGSQLSAGSQINARAFWQ